MTQLWFSFDCEPRSALSGPEFIFRRPVLGARLSTQTGNSQLWCFHDNAGRCFSTFGGRGWSGSGWWVCRQTEDCCWFKFFEWKKSKELWCWVKVVSCFQTTACLIESRRTTSATPPPWMTRTRGCSRSPTQSRTLWRVTPCGGSSSAPWRGCTCSTCAGRGRPSFTRECSLYFTLLANFFILKISWVNWASYLLP